LHDEVGQLLTGLTCLSRALVERLRGHDDLAAEEATAIGDVAREALAQTRALARGLAPVKLARRGLPASLADLRKTIRHMHEVDLQLDLPAEAGNFEGELAGHLFRIAQEAITNAVRHGHATTIRICLKQIAGNFRFGIVDNGRGFDPDEPRESPGSGLGLMEYRAALIGGCLHVSSERNSGTHVDVFFPPTNPIKNETAC
jgi:signal transduction histidine kinase